MSRIKEKSVLKDRRDRWLNKGLTKLEILSRDKHKYGSAVHGESVERHPAWLKILVASPTNYKHSVYIVSRSKDSTKIRCKIACH